MDTLACFVDSKNGTNKLKFTDVFIYYKNHCNGSLAQLDRATAF